MISQFPGLEGDTTSQPNAVNALQQAANDLANGDINNVSNSAIQQALISQFPGIEINGRVDADWSFTNVINNDANGAVLPDGFLDADDTSGKKLYQRVPQAPSV